MAVVKMKLVKIAGQKSSLNQLAEVCGSVGFFHPVRASEIYPDLTHFVDIQEDNPYSAPLARLKADAEAVGIPLPKEREAFFGKAHAEADSIPDEQLFRQVDTFHEKVTALLDTKAKLSAKYLSQTENITQFEHFIGLDIDLYAVLHTETIKVRFGRLPKESYEKLNLYNSNPYVMFFPGAESDNYYWGMYFAPKEFADTVDRIFTCLYFERMQIPEAAGTPEEIVQNLTARRAATEAKLKQLETQLEEIRKYDAGPIQRLYAQLYRRDYCFNIHKYAVQYRDNTILLTGWIPADCEEAFLEAMHPIPGIDCTIERAEETAGHPVPVKLKNFSLFRPFEFFVDMYGLPRYNQMDPTAFVAITYSLLFGIMFGDVGQGLVVALVGWLMWRLKRMAIGRILIPCGISASLFGFVYGSVFGFEHLLDPMYHSLGFAEKPVDVMESRTAVTIMVGAVALGIALTLFSICLNIYSGLKERNFERAIFGQNGLAGFVFLAALTVGFGGKLAFGWDILTLPYILLLIVLPLLLIFLREPLGKLLEGDKHWMPESWGEYILQNFFEEFEILLSYMSNVVSFLRVAAFVLIHAGMMMAVFALANLFGSVGYTITVILGNLLVMGMEALLVAIQVLRLEYYELFSRYYEGDGKAFAPL